MKLFLKILSGLTGGLLVAFIGSFSIGMLVSNVEFYDQASVITLPVFYVLAIILSVTASRPAKSWRRIFISSALLIFTIPVSVFVSSLGMASELQTISNDQAAQTGILLGGAASSTFMGFLSFFIGGIFLIIGLLIGRSGG